MVEGTENVYMLCWYQAGDAGMESDDFGLCCKFFADSEADADRQFAECKQKYPEIAEDLFVQPYNEYFDQYDEFDPYDDSYNVYQNLEVWFKQAEKNRRDFEEYGDIPFEASEDVSREPVVGSMIGFDCPRCHNKGTVFDVDREAKMPYDVDYHDTCICDECASEFYAEPQYDGTMKFVDIDEDDIYSSTCVNCDTKDLTFIENRDGYLIYRRVVDDANGPRGEWFAQVNDESSDPFPITYMQAIGREDIVPSMTKEVGKKMLPDQTIEGTWVYDDDDLFTTEERDLLMDSINNLLPGFAWVSGCWIDKNIITTRIETEDGYEYEVQQKIDFRKLRTSYSDIVKYAPIIADLAIQQISQDYAVEGSVCCNESTSGKSTVEASYDYATFDELVKYYSSFYMDDPTVSDWIWANIVSDYNDEDLANDVIAQLEDDYASGEMWDDSDSIYSAEEIDEDTASEYDLNEIDQEFDSQLTRKGNSRPGSTPKLFTLVAAKFGWPKGSVILDYGCGGEENQENVINYLSKFDVEYIGYDKYMPAQAKRDAIKRVRDAGGADIVTCSNVLNTIKESEVRLNILENMKKEAKPGAAIYITAWRDPKGVEGPTGKGRYQLHWKLDAYLDEIRQVFPDADRTGELIFATNGGQSVNSAVHIPQSDIELVMREAADVQSDEDLDAVLGALLSIDKSLYNKYIDMINSNEYSPAAIGKQISDDLYYITQDVTAATNTCGIGVAPSVLDDEDNYDEY
ncbi:MAG: hypothetical protein IJE78_05750 [Bacteroidaceae bacterium]|nr:hypothetical protein [Bacteroidaceae bacterium]